MFQKIYFVQSEILLALSRQSCSTEVQEIPPHGFYPMDSTVKLPIDLNSLPPFRELKLLLGLERALFVWWTLWQELGYRAQEGNCPGRLPLADVPSFLASLEPTEPNAEQRAQLLQHLVSVRLLKQDGEDFVCPRFAMLHGEMGQRSQAQRGGDMRAFKLRMKKAGGQSFQQALLISETKLVDAEGQPLAAEEVKRVTRLIVCCDNALYKDPRPSYGFTEGLIQDALRVLKRFTDEEIDFVCNKVALHRNHPALNGFTTEKLLPVFTDIVQKMEGQ
jgi:hypothetical protein